MAVDLQLFLESNDFSFLCLTCYVFFRCTLSSSPTLAQLKQVSSDASVALGKAKTALKATAGRLGTLESDVAKAQKIVDGAEKTLLNAETKYKMYQADKVEQERKAAIERKQAQEVAKKKQAEQRKKDQQAAEKMKKAREKAQQKAKAEAKTAAERQRKEDEVNSKKRQEQAKKDAKRAKENTKKRQEQAKKDAERAKKDAERSAKEYAAKIESAKKKVEQMELEKRKLIVQEGKVPKSKMEAMEKKLQGARDELKAVVKSSGK
jgi:hypothetical protein